MHQESHDDILDQLEGILSGKFKPPPGESAGQWAFICFQQTVQETKELTSVQLLKLSQLAPRYLSFSTTQPKEILRPLFQDLESAVKAHLSLGDKVNFYRGMAEACAKRGWWFNSHPQAGRDIEVLDYVIHGLSLADSKPFEAIGHRLYIHAVQTLQAEIHQQKWPEEKKELTTECEKIFSDSKSSFATVYQFAERLATSVQRLTFILPDERRQLWATWSAHWDTQQEEIDHKATEEGDGIFQQFRCAVLDWLNPDNQRSFEELKPLCQQQHQMIKAMSRYEGREKARWQLHRYRQLLTKTREKLLEGTGKYYRRSVEEKPHWVAAVDRALAAGHALNTTLADIPSGFPETLPENIAQQWLSWRRRFEEIEHTTATPTLDQIPNALRRNANQARTLWADILAGCVDLLGPPPCPIAWVPAGSIAREESLPTSDFDGFLLTGDNRQNSSYLNALIHLLWFHGLLLPHTLFPLESQDFKAMLNTSELYCQFLNTPEAFAGHFLALINGRSTMDHLLFSVGFPGVLFLEEPPEGKPTHRILWQYQEELLKRYKTALTKDAPQEYARRLARWIMQHLASQQTNNTVAQLKSFFELGGAPSKINLKDHLLRPLTWWCLAMKLAYDLPDTAQSSHAILEAFKTKNIFPLVWLQQLQQWESQIHYWRWTKHQPTLQELQTAYQQIYYVLGFSTAAWLEADEKQHPPTLFHPPEAMIRTILTDFSTSPPGEEQLANERDQIKYLARLPNELYPATSLYPQIPLHWRGIFVDESVAAMSQSEIKTDRRLTHRFKAISRFLGNEETKLITPIASSIPADISPLTQLSEATITELPNPPCPFWPFVLPQQNHGRYILGIVVADEKYNSHDYFSHWVECFAEIVMMNSAELCPVDISMVNRFLRNSEYPTHFLIGTTAQLATQTESFATELADTGPMRWLSREEKATIPFHHRLSWQRDLLALTSEQPDGKEPCAQLSWPEVKNPRYLSPQLTRRLFHTQGKNAGQLASAQRSATPGQSDVWRLTAKDFSQLLPEYSSNTILGYLKTHPAHLWRQWQHATLVQRIMPDYGVTGSVAMLQYDAKSEPIPVWLSSPAGLTLCSLDDHKTSESSPDIQLLDEKGQARFSQYAAQLDPYPFTLLVFLTYLLVHEDDQLRNLGWRLFMNALGATVSKIIPFDTDTCLGPPWIRTGDGKVQIKLKSVVFCLDAMAQQPLDTAAIEMFRSLDPITVLEEWLKEINVVTAPENTLPADALDALYQRWQQIRSVLELPQESKDPMAPIFPRTHLDWLELVDPVLGQAYREAHRQHINPLERFTAIAQDYVVVDKMWVSKHTGTLRGASVAALSRTVQISSFHMKPEQALARCRQYRQQQQKVQPLVAYLKQHASWPTAIFEEQISRVIGDMPKLNRQTQERIEQHHQQQNDLERLRTRASLWQPLAEDPDLSIILILPDSKTPQSLDEWQTTCTQTAKPGLRLVKSSKNTPWEIDAHNGKNLIINGQPVDKTLEMKEGSEEAKRSWDLSSWQKHLTSQPNIPALRAACRLLYRNEQPAILRLQQSVEETERALKQLAEQRQNRISRQPRPEIKSSAVPPSESDPDFLLDLQDLLLRQAVLRQLPWGQLPTEKGLDQVLRLLELGGLTELNLQDCAAAPEALVLACIQNSPDLRRLNISGCINITDNSLLQIAGQARNLARLAARGLPKVKELWQGFLWLTHIPLRFPYLTHLDLRNSTNLARLHLQAPELRYLHLGNCGTLSGQEWILETPQLKMVSLAGCHLSRVSIQSDTLTTLDVSGAVSLTLPVLKAMLAPEQWANIRTLTLDGCKRLNDWLLLNYYLFLTPLADEHLSIDKLNALHSVFTRPQITADIARLPPEGQWQLKWGLALFFWGQSRDLFKRVIEWSLSDLGTEVSGAALKAVGQIGIAHPALAGQALTACLSRLDSDYVVSIIALETVGQIGAANPALAGQALTACLSRLNDSSSDLRRVAEKAVSEIVIAHPALADQALTAYLSPLNDSRWPVRQAAITAVGQIAIVPPALAGQTLTACLSRLNDPNSWIRENALTAVGQIGAANPALAAQALTACLSRLNDSSWGARKAAVTAVEQIGTAHASAATKAVLTLCFPLLEDKAQQTRSAARKSITRLITAQPKLIYPLLTRIPKVLKNPDKAIASNAIHLFASICVDYHVRLDQTLKDYITHFLRQWFSQHPVESTSLSLAQDFQLSTEKKPISVVTDSQDSSSTKQWDAAHSTALSSIQSNTNAIGDASIKRKRERSETDSKFLVGVLPHSNKEFKALEKPVSGDGNCGFNALGITRQKIFNMLDSCVNNAEARSLISTEIHEFFLSGLLESMQGALDDKSYNQLSELKACRAAIASAEQKFNTKKDEINQLLDGRSINNEDKATPLVNRLCQRLEFYKPANYSTFINELKQLHSSVIAAQQNYQAQLESESTYMAYANAYLINREERPKLWLGYQTALLYARFSVTQPINLYIWKKITPDGKQIACEASHYHYASEGCATYHILHTDGYTHFNSLEPAKTARLSQESFLVQASPRDPTTSSSLSLQLS